MTHLRLATAEEGRAILSAEDDFTRALGTFDRSFRLRTTAPVDDETVRRFLGEQAMDFTAEESAAWNEALEIVAPASRGLGRVLPPEVVVLKTTGREERDHAYTRGNAIILPETRVRTWRGERAVRLLAHELFHVASRASSALRDAAYALLGFEKCAITLPADLDDKRITNPDAYSVDHYLQLGDRAVVPLLICPKPLSEVLEATTVVNLAKTMLLVIDPVSGTVAPDLVLASETDWAKTIGRNSKYTIHPEEVLADNFMLLAHLRLGSKETPSDPALLTNLEQLLSRNLRESASDRCP